MFWRFGSDEESRPVAATAWWNVVWRRPSAGDERRQRVDVRRAELRVDAPLEELVDHRMGRSQVLEHRRIGRVAGLRPLALRQVELEEEDLLELLGAAEVELVADVGVDLRLEPRDLRRELRRQDAERVEIEGDAGRLHPGQDRDERQLDLRVEAVESVLGQAPLERLADRDRGERLEAGPGRAVELGDRRQDEVELLGDDVGDRLAAERGVQDVGRDLRVEGDRRRRRGGVVGDAGDEQRLDLVADDRGVEPPAGSGAASRRRPAPRPRPSGRRVPATASASGEPRRGRGSSRSSPIPTAGWAASHGSRAAIRSPAWTSIRDGSLIAAARAAGRSSGPTAAADLRAIGDPGRIAAASPAVRPAATRRRNRARAGARRPRTAAAPAGPSPSRTAGRTRRPGPPAPSRRSRPRAAPRRRHPAVSPVIAGRRSMSERNSYSRNSRMTVSRS